LLLYPYIPNNGIHLSPLLHKTQIAPPILLSCLHLFTKTSYKLAR
jgi:hypothetical protein